MLLNIWSKVEFWKEKNKNVKCDLNACLNRWWKSEKGKANWIFKRNPSSYHLKMELCVLYVGYFPFGRNII